VGTKEPRGGGGEKKMEIKYFIYIDYICYNYIVKKR